MVKVELDEKLVQTYPTPPYKNTIAREMLESEI